ncbi:MAG: hypothetical protein VX460_00365 [Planctomycetota bacterium]|nr:hypothetical protein [Planctomycetota bacterium]
MTRPQTGPPPFPERLERNLRSYRRTMRRTKLTEHFAVALTALVASFLVVAALDRLFDTSALVRALLLGVALAVAAFVVPRALSRWYLRHRDLREVAREVARRDAAKGDRLLGVFELTRDAAEFARSPELVTAAVAQGERDLGDDDLADALPPSRHRRAAALAAIPAAAVLTFTLTLPEVAGNAFARWAAPFASVERYTFARVDGLKSEWFVPIQEARTVRLDLDEGTRTRPDTATLHLRGGAVRAERAGDGYTLELPPLAEDERALLVVGDLRETIALMPRQRPEVVGAEAAVTLPGYLGLDQPVVGDVRGGSLVVVEGARVDLGLTVSRGLASAGARVLTGEGEARDEVAHEVEVDGDHVVAATLLPSMFGPDGRAKLQLSWTDELGLEGHADFTLGLRTRPDEEPVVALSGAEAESVLLETVALSFDVLSSDDFGVRRAGLEWRRSGRLGGFSEEPDGEKVLGAGAADAATLQSFATLKPAAMGLEAGVFEVRGWAEDALPGRERSTSAPIRVRVMTPDQHMQWVTAQLERWRERAVEVRDREMELLAENRALHALGNAQLDSAEARTRIENQARAERGNRARLQGLVAQGKELLSEAARNEEFGSNALDDWAEAGAKLQEIAETRMDSVAKLLRLAARAEASSNGSPAQPSQGGMQQAASSGQAPQGSAGEESDARLAAAKPPQDSGSNRPEDGGESPKIIGQDRGQGGGSASQGAESEEDEGRPEDAIPPTPTIMDGESGVAMRESGDEPEEADQEGGAPKASLGMVETTLAPVAREEEEPTDPNITPGGGPEDERPSLTKAELAKAIAEQEALLEAFNEVAGDIESVLAALENSTFVKRLKAAARAQTESSEELDGSVARGFGSEVATSHEEVQEVNASVSRRRDGELRKLTNLHADMDAYLDRLSSRASEDAPKFERVLSEWNDLRPTLLADALVAEAEGGRPGDARASADFLSDTFDRWGEELVGPG